MIVVRIDGKVVSSTNESWSNVDPGGFEACSFNVPNAREYPDPNSEITIWDGLSLVWEGRVEEPGDNYSRNAALGQVSGVGYGARLRDDSMSMIFIDRDVSRWQGMSISRRVAHGTTRNPQNDGTVITDDAGSPGIKLDLTGELPGSSGGVAEIFYDAGEDNRINQLQWSSTQRNVNSGSANWHTTLFADSISAFNVSPTTIVDLGGSGDISFRRDTIASERWLLIQLLFGVTLATTDERYRVIKDVAVIGDHGVTLRQNGAGTDGYYPHDIVNYVCGLVDGIDSGNIEESTSYTTIQLAYPDKVQHEQVITDMATLMGWHWGVWESRSMLFGEPRLDFCARPSSPTVVVDSRECAEITLSRSLSAMYNRARVSYTDALGAKSYLTVDLPHPDLKNITRTIDLDLGIATSTQATTFGTQVLQLTQVDSRAQGSVTLPAKVVAGTRGYKKASHLIRAGLDRINVQGLPNGVLTDAVESNSFRVKRVICEKIGSEVKTTVEIDNGADLIEVLQARLAQAAFGSTFRGSPQVPVSVPGRSPR